jgi:hypothetical protein
LELHQKYLGVERSPIFLTEDEPMLLICLPQEQPFFGLVRFVAPEGCHTFRGQGEGPLRLGRLRLMEGQFRLFPRTSIVMAPDADQLLADMYDSSRQVEILPAHGQQFSTP